MQLTPSLESSLSYRYVDLLRDSTAGIPKLQTQTHELTSTWIHQFYKSLTNSLQFYGSQSDLSGGGREDEFSIQLNTSYAKKTALGDLSLGTQMGYRKTERDSSLSGLIEVLDEARTFQDPLPERLDNENVVQSSIFVTAADGVTIYAESMDYVVRQVGTYTELERLPGGAIADGETVLVDYVYDLSGRADLDTKHLAFYARFDLPSGIGLYYKFLIQNQTAGNASMQPVAVDDVNSDIFGVDYHDQHLRLAAEFESRDSTLNGHDTFRADGSLTQRIGRAGRARFSASYSNRHQTTPISRDIDLYFVRGNYRSRLGEDVYLEGSVTNRNRTDSLAGDDHGWDAEAKLEWLHNDIQVNLRAQYNQFRGEFNQNNTWLFMLQVKRLF